MRKLLIIFLLFLFVKGFGQTTPFSPTQIGASSNYFDFGRGFEEWNGQNTWDNVTSIEIPNGVVHGKNYYYRFYWPFLETGNRVYNWAIFDTQIQYAISHGLTFSFRIQDMCTACSSTGGVSGLTYPLFLHTLMQGETTNSKDWQDAGGFWIPNWNSPNYQAGISNLLNDVATHIAGGSFNGVSYSSVIYYIDITGFGDFGEWHTSGWTGTEPTGRTATAGSLQAIIDASRTAFPNFQLDIPIACFGNNTYCPSSVGYYALTASNTYGRIGWRRDNWGNGNEDNTLVNSTNSYNPGDSVHNFKYIIVQSYKWSIVDGEPNNTSGTFGAPYADLAREVSLYHPTSIGDGNFPSGQAANSTTQANIIAASRTLGYRLTLDSGSTSTAAVTGGSFQIRMFWNNLGIAPLYEKYNVIYEWRNGLTVVRRDTSAFKPYLFQTGGDSLVNETFTISGVAAGTYGLYIIVKDVNGYRTPLTLNITGRQADGSYLIRNITVTSTGNPVANAGPSLSITAPASSVTMDGTGSSGTITTKTWSQDSGPNTAVITTPSSLTTTITGLQVGTYVFRLTVTTPSNFDTMQVVVNPALPPATNVYSTQIPGNGTGNDSNVAVGIELGLKFRTSIAGWVTGARFWKTSGNNGTHIGELYSYPAGTRLAQATFTNETLTGWQYVTFATPIFIAANTTYVIAYYSASGNYTYTAQQFASAIVNVELTGLADGTDGFNGVFDYAAAPQLPINHFNKNGYWVDVVFSVTFPNLCNCHPRITSGSNKVISH
jgi:hypothetical protein